MKLSQSVTYAIHAVLRLVNSGNIAPVNCGKLAADGKMPERFLLQVLRDLAKAGILHSTRGGRGGFLIRRPIEMITLLDVIEAVDGPITAALPLKANFPGDTGERLSSILENVTANTRQQLHEVRVCDLAKPLATPGTLIPFRPRSQVTDG